MSAPKTVTNQLLCLQVVLKRAVRWRLISRNPVSDCDRPRVEPPELHVLSEVEIARLLTAYRELEAVAEAEEKVWWEIARTLTFVCLGTVGMCDSEARQMHTPVHTRYSSERTLAQLAELDVVEPHGKMPH